MSFNGAAIVSAALAFVFCVYHFVSRIPEPIVNTEKQQVVEEVELTMPTLPDDVVSRSKALFIVKQEQEQQTQNKPEEVKRIEPRQDELAVDGKLIRLVGVFQSSSSNFAVVEERNADTGQNVKQTQVTKEDKLGAFSVADVSLNQIVLTNEERTIIFELYKKPRLIKG